MPYRTKEERNSYAKKWREQNPEYRKNWGREVEAGQRTVKPQERDGPYATKGRNKWIERYPERYREQMNKQKRRRLENKLKLIELMGGQCQMCGYDKYLGALEFDHIDPTSKSFNISQWIHRDISYCLEEIKKCRLLCANCHREHGARPKQDKYNVLQ